MEQTKVFVDINNARGRVELEQKLQKIIDAGEDPFSLEHIGKYHGKPILQVRSHWYATESDHKYPGAKQHFLIIATEYKETIDDISSEAFVELLAILKDLCRTYAIPAGGFFFRFGDTSYTGATVKRLHAHLIHPDPDGNGVRIPLG